MKTDKNFTKDQIEQFLQGSNDLKYVVAIETDYHTNIATLVLNTPNKLWEKGRKDIPQSTKTIEVEKYKPFLWFKEDVTKMIYKGNRLEIIKAEARYGVKMKLLRTCNDKNETPERLENGFKFMAICNRSYNDLLMFFKEGLY